MFDIGKIIPDTRLSLRDGAVEPLGKYRNNMLFAILEMLGRRYDFTLDDPVESFSEEALNAVLYGDSEPLTVDLSEFSSPGGRQFLSWEGVAEYIGRTEDDDSKRGQKWRDQFLVYRKWCYKLRQQCFEQSAARAGKTQACGRACSAFVRKRS